MATDPLDFSLALGSPSQNDLFILLNSILFYIFYNARDWTQGLVPAGKHSILKQPPPSQPQDAVFSHIMKSHINVHALDIQELPS